MRAPADVAVIGTGIAGLACAHTLLRRGHRVTLVGPRTGAHSGQATRAAGAMLSTFSEAEDGHGPERMAVEQAERLAAHDAWPAFADELSTPQQQVVLRRGTWVLGTAGAPGALQVIADAAAAAGHPWEEHPAGQVPVRPDPRPAGTALWLPSEAWTDSAVLMEALTRAVATHPASTWHTAPATAVTLPAHAADPVRADLTDATHLTAHQVVLAAGTATPALLPDRGRPLGLAPILAGRGVSALLATTAAATEHVVRTPNDRFACGVHLVPREDGTLYLGGTNRLTLAPDPHLAASVDEAASLLHDATTVLDHRLRTAGLLALRTGLRPYTPDHQPLIGPLADERLLVAGATYRCGILLAPRLATLIADEIDTPGTLATHPWRTLRPMPRPRAGEVVDRAAAGLVEHILQHGGRLAPGGARELEAFLALALRAMVQGPGPELDAVARLFSGAPVPEVLPSLYAMAGRLGGRP
ncbi:NAD(P)/FAD-dependent oxidoreductase [Kitasatospora indigofera]|uniref:NAD(P)/FAD-dependent oxidoreductase n=1 Tax=Kitasatospora indigofera TaxID=67307 RepID=UPI0036A87DEC